MTKNVQATFELFLSQDYLLLSFNQVLKQNFPGPIKSEEGKLYSHWEQTRAGNGSPSHHTDVVLREMDGYNGKARRRKRRCPQRMTDGVFIPLAPETRGSITSASAGTGPLCCWGAGSGPRVGTKCRCRGSPSVAGRGSRGPPWRGPEWCTRECACAHLCVGAVHVMLSTVYYSYIHRNKNVARGGGRESQEGRDIRNLRVIQVDVWQKSSDTAQNDL